MLLIFTGLMLYSQGEDKTLRRLKVLNDLFLKPANYMGDGLSLYSFIRAVKLSSSVWDMCMFECCIVSTNHWNVKGFYCSVQ